MRWRRCHHVCSTAPNRTSVSARRSRSRCGSTFSFDIGTRRSRKFAPVDKAVCRNVAARNIAGVGVVAVAVDAPADGNCLRRCGTGAPVRVRRVCTDGPCRVHGRLGTVPLLLLLLLRLLRLLRRRGRRDRRDRCRLFLSSPIYSSSFPSSPPFSSSSFSSSPSPSSSSSSSSPSRSSSSSSIPSDVYLLFSSPHLREGLLETGRFTGPEIPIPTSVGLNF